MLKADRQILRPASIWRGLVAVACAACGDPSSTGEMPRDFAWYLPEAGSTATPAMDSSGRTLFAYLESGQVVAIDAAKGIIKWRSAPSGSAFGTNIAVIGDVVAVADVDVLGFNARNGALLWIHGRGTSNEGLRPIATDGAAFYLASRDGRVSKVNPESGADIWVADLAAGDTTVGAFGATVANGRVYVCANQFLATSFIGGLFALDAQTGARVWQFQYDLAPGRFQSTACTTPPAVLNDLVVAAVGDGRIFAHDIVNGGVRWTSPSELADSLMSGEIRYVAVGDAALIATSSPGHITRLDPATGTVRWRAKEIGGTPIRGPAFGIGLVAVAHGAEMVAYDLNSGTGRFAAPNYDLGSPPPYRVFAGPLINEGVIYWVGTDGIRARKLP